MLSIHSLPSKSFQVHVPAYVLSFRLHKVYKFKYCIAVPGYINLWPTTIVTVDACCMLIWNSKPLPCMLEKH